MLKYVRKVFYRFLCNIIPEHNNEQMVKEFRRKTASPTCHPSWLRMDSSDVDLHLKLGFLDPRELVPKRHLDRFSRVLHTWLRNLTNRQTHRQITLLCL